MPGLWIQYHTVKRAGTHKMAFCHKSVMFGHHKNIWFYFLIDEGKLLWTFWKFCLVFTNGQKYTPMLSPNCNFCQHDTVRYSNQNKKLVGDTMFSLMVIHSLD